MNCTSDAFGLLVLSSAISSHLLSKHHFNVQKSWIANKWFWAGFFGNLPALVALTAHIFLSRGKAQ